MLKNKTLFGFRRLDNHDFIFGRGDFALIPIAIGNFYSGWAELGICWDPNRAIEQILSASGRQISLYLDRGLAGVSVRKFKLGFGVSIVGN